MINSFDQEKLKRISEISIKDQKEGKTEERLKKIDNQNRYDKLVEKYKEEGKSSVWIEELLGKRPETGLEDHNLFKDDLNRIIFFDDFSELKDNLNYEELVELDNCVIEYNDFVGNTDEFIERLDNNNSFKRFGIENFVDWYEGVKSTKDFIEDYYQLNISIDNQKEISDHLKNTLFDIFDKYDDYDNISRDLRSLNSSGKLTDEEYNNILVNYEDLVKEYECNIEIKNLNDQAKEELYNFLLDDNNEIENQEDMIYDYLQRNVDKNIVLSVLKKELEKEELEL